MVYLQVWAGFVEGKRAGTMFPIRKFQLLHTFEASPPKRILKCCSTLMTIQCNRNN